MKANFFHIPFRGFGLMMAVLGLIWLTGCCDGSVDVSGSVIDAQTGAPIDSVRVSLFYVEHKQAQSSIFEYTDSLGGFYLWDAGYCGKTRFFVIASKTGYVTQSLDVESYGPEIEIRMQAD